MRNRTICFAREGGGRGRPPPEENWEVLEVWVGGRAPWEKLEGSGAGGVVVGRW